MLALLRRSFSTNITVQSKKQLYVSLVRSQLSFCLVLWKLYLLKDVKLLEQLQCRATKYILNDYTSDYKHRLKTLKILPLMYFLDISDIMFPIKCLKTSNSAFNIKNYINSISGGTRLAISNKLQHNRNSNISSANFYFNRLPWIWNALPIINCDLSVATIKRKLQIIHALIHFYVHVVNVTRIPHHLALTPCNLFHIQARVEVRESVKLSIWPVQTKFN